MKVKELIELLGTFPPSLDVCIEVDDESRLIEVREATQVLGTNAVLLVPASSYYKIA